MAKVYGCRHFDFHDDTFNLYPRRVEELCATLQIRNANYHWGCFCRAAQFSPALASAMVNAGCNVIQFGVESGSETVLRSSRKRTSKSQIEAAVRAAASAGIKQVVCGFIIGHATDTPSTIRETIDFGLHLRDLGATRLTLSLLTPYPGTEVYNKRDEFGIHILTNDWEQYTFSRVVIETSRLHREELRQLYVNGLNRFLTQQDTEPTNGISPLAQTTRPSRYMDILFLTALEEEAFVLEQLFRDSVGSVLNASYERIDTTFNSTQTVPCVRLTVSPSVTIQLSWMCLGGMGNVFAFGKALEAINTLSPRCVILLGLMAGRNDGTRKRGDVGYGRIIGYSSLSKIEAIPIATEIAALEKLKSHEIDVNVVIEALKQIGVDINDTLPHITYRTADLTEEWVHFTNVAEKHRKDPGSWQRLAQVSFETLRSSLPRITATNNRLPFVTVLLKHFRRLWPLERQ